ncbi:Diguanylate cyclase (GGDEF) domain-containing protein [uncultured Stenotrophomonas sp.]|uniref:diguanylate cyclase n=1 Tax=uncultured Stenotrophomonas sp. TaxID=165438 RepID=A0A1Y5QCE0_9GAMM|nr:Diguanylate cyclase (GGDEF) domain-containing protein [uncultured Stenotrophomonas sp.]
MTGRAIRSCRRLVLLCLCLLLPAAWGNDGRHYMVSGWTMDDGLPHNMVHVIAQDRDGFIWAGTWEGVVRFNGRHFTVFDRQNTPGAELSGVFSILPEDDGGVLFGTAADGVFRYHRGRWQPLGVEEEAHHLPVSGMLRDRDGALWIASAKRLLRMDGDGYLHDAGAAAGLPAARVTALVADGEGGLLVATEAGGVARLRDGQANAWGVDWLGTELVRALARDGEGGWLAGGDDGVRWRHADGRVEHFRPGQRVDAVLRDRLGAIWMNFSSGQLVRRSNGDDERLQVPGTVGQALLEDREGLVWVGGTDGLHRVAEVAAVGFTQEDGLGSDYVRSVLQSGDGALWIGHAGGLNRWYRGEMQTIGLVPDGGRNPSVLSLDYRDGMLWAGTYDRGVLRLDMQGRVRERIRLGEHTEPMVRAVLADAGGGVWIGGAHGLVHYRDGRQESVLDSQGQPQSVVQALYRDVDGTLWIGTTGGMAALDGTGAIRRWAGGRDMPAQYVFDFLRDAAGDLWIASDRGLLRMRGDTFHVYDHRHGLPRDKLFRIIDDQRGNFWLSSNHGVFRVARGEFDQLDAGTRRLLAVHVVDRSDGMPGDQGNGASMPSGWRADNGALLFPTSAGLGLIDPRIAGHDDERVPPVVFESLAVDGIEQPLQAAGLRLGPGTRRLVVGYAALNFRAPNKLRYRYRLHGFDAGWVEAGARTEALYTNLPPGRYRLEVQAMTLPLDWARQEAVGSAVMALEVVPPLWKRPSSRLLGLLLLAGAVALGFWLHTASYRRNQRRLNREITARTEELSEKNRALEAADRERGSLMQRLEHQATHDELTGLPNRRAADRRLHQAVVNARSAATPLCVALADVDHFKHINDNHGHEVGDHVLQRIATVLCGGDAGMVFAARHGGEEFLLVLEGMGRTDALRRLHELHARVAGLQVAAPDGSPVPVTISIGAAHLQPGCDDARSLLVAADRQLYQAKRKGRNRVVG